MLIALAAAPKSTESAIANGDTRTIVLSSSHTNESGSFTYMVNGAYDMAVLEKLNWFLRDWRLNEETKMDPKLFDILWEVYRESGSTQPIDVLSGYRSPQTNAMLRRRSRQVAEHSQHMQGKAIDAHFIDVGPGAIRDIAMRMQAGGVGFYPSRFTPWVHIDSGAVRYWPRMSRDALTRLFPDGKTVFIPADGQPMPGYDLARAEIEARGGDVVTASSASTGLFAWLFGGPRGGGADDAEESGDESMVVAGNGSHGRASGAVSNTAIAEAKRDLPRGDTVAQAAPVAAQPVETSAPEAAPQPTTLADAADSQTDGSVTLRGPIAQKFIAPLPPRKPPELIGLALAQTPMPPTRPVEYAVASAASKPVEPPPRPPEYILYPPVVAPSSSPAGGNRDLILALLERGKLPGVITRGLAGAPRDALALAETAEVAEPPGRPGILAKAAALDAPLPPIRPPDSFPPPPPTRPAEVTTLARSAPGQGGAPYGALALDAFDETAAPSPAATALKAKMAASN